MKKFAVYYKSDKFHPTTNQVFYTFNLIVIICWFILEKMLKITTANSVLGWMAVSTWIIALLAMLYGLMRPPPLRGTLNGFITFENDKILVGDKVYLLNDIKLIKISNEDYYGRNKRRGRGDFNASYSNGVDNELIIILNSDTVDSFHFELYNAADLQKVRKELINYYRQGKLEFSDLCNILGLTKSDEMEYFKIHLV